MSAHVVRLVVLPVEALADASQAFRCEPFSAVIPARTCLARRRNTYVGARNQSTPATVYPEFASCARCELGARVEAAVAERRNGRTGSARLIGLSMRTSPSSTLTVSRTFDGALRLRELEEKVKDEKKVACGEMNGSFYESVANVGGTPAVISEAAKLFSHKIDFSRDIHEGDRFCLVFDRKVTESGRTIEAGDLEYAEVKGQKFYAFDRKDSDGKSQFFDELGKNIKGFLLRTPVDGARITSVFGMRKHPVLGYTRAHQGVDFGAGTGTPILAAGDGVVLEAKRWGGYGNWLRIRHAGQWDTGYGHISRYAPGIHAGSRVRQGQVVAYVGSTGLASGPHLHYEVWDTNGNKINPQVWLQNRGVSVG